MGAWIGVDLDGTLAEYHGWNYGIIGKPVPAMVTRILSWLAKGQDVKIFTARVADPTQAVDQVPLIEAWCLEHIGQVLPITATKDHHCIQIWDDRAVSVQSNTGRWIDYETYHQGTVR